jgi:hypothetical protein
LFLKNFIEFLLKDENDWRKINDLLPGIDKSFILKSDLKSKKYTWNKEKDEILLKIMKS